MELFPDYDQRTLPKVRDSMTYLYFEHCLVEQEGSSIAIFTDKERIQVPAASLSVLMLGPGSSISHAAIRTLADNSCIVVWVGEEGNRFYAWGFFESARSARLELQARLWADPQQHEQVVRRMYQLRLGKSFPPHYTLEQMRGMEGVRVRSIYQQCAQHFKVEWSGRSYKYDDWEAANPVNRAISAANACLYGFCLSAILAGGYSPTLGFIHTGKMLSFVWDIADLYKTDTTIPLGFEVAAQNPDRIDRVVRRRCREVFYKYRLRERILPDIERLFDFNLSIPEPPFDWEKDPYRPFYWDPPSPSSPPQPDDKPKPKPEDNDWS